MGEAVGGEHEAVVVQGIKLFGKTIVLPAQQTIKGGEQEEETTEEANDDDGGSGGNTGGESTSTTTTTAADHNKNNRPDKIIPCPRCKSMETKFCYFNNYNVNQPRHFCKGCQRYWTAGGTLRNVPVGAGRRKAKPPGRSEVLMGGFSTENCIFDASVVNNFDLDRVVLEEWARHHHQQQQLMAATAGRVYCDFPAKRRRINGSKGPINC